MPKVSVIIPVYNVEKYLRQCLDSVVNQTFKDIEIICVNDGSPDNSLAILEEYAANDSRIVIINKENGGYASAINKGIEIANGEFIGIVESDDYCATDMYEELYNRIKDSDADFVAGNFYYLKETKHKVKEYSYCEGLNLDNDGSFNLKSSPNVLVKVAYPWKNLYRKSFLDKNNIRMLQDGKGAYEDQPWNTMVLSKAKKILTLDKPIYYYRVDAAGSSTNNGTRKIINYLKRRAQGRDILIECGLFEGDILEYYYLAALNGGRTFMRTIAKEFKEEYYNVYKELLLPAYEEGLTFKYFPNKKKRRFERIIKYDYNKYKNTYYLCEFLGFIKDMVQRRDK